MKKWLKRIRGAIGLGLTWAAVWSAVGAIIGLASGGSTAGITTAGLAFLLAGTFAALGFVGGVIFSAALGIVEGRRRFDEMSLPSFASWGGMTGAFVFGSFLAITGAPPLGFSIILVSVATLLGAGSAAGSLALARRAEDRELLEAGEEALGLSEGG